MDSTRAWRGVKRVYSRHMTGRFIVLEGQVRLLKSLSCKEWLDPTMTVFTRGSGSTESGEGIRIFLLKERYPALR